MVDQERMRPMDGWSPWVDQCLRSLHFSDPVGWMIGKGKASGLSRTSTIYLQEFSFRTENKTNTHSTTSGRKSMGQPANPGLPECSACHECTSDNESDTQDNITMFVHNCSSPKIPYTLLTCIFHFPNITARTWKWDLACQERKCSGTSASRDDNGQMDVWC